MKNAITVYMIWRWGLGLMIISVQPGSAADSAGEAPLTYGCKGQDLLEMRRRARAGDVAAAEMVEALRHKAEGYLTGKLWTVIDKPFAGPSGDKHDYVSLASYCWPNPQTANGLPYVSRDGEINPESYQYDRKRLDSMVAGVHTLALAYYHSGEEAYAERAAQQLRAWFLDAPTRMNPHLQYAQMIKGKNEGSSFGIIETETLPWTLDGVALLRRSRSWSTEDHRRLQQWFGDYLAWMRTSEPGRAEARADNNHGTLYDVQTVTFALFTDQKALAKEIIESAKIRRIGRQIEPDGSLPAELKRTRSRHYVLLNLTAFFRLARLGELGGVDLWHYRTADGRSIRAALDWVIPYATGKQPWTHQQIDPQSYAPMIYLLRQAAIVYNEPAYERAIGQLAIAKAEIRKDHFLYPPPNP